MLRSMLDHKQIFISGLGVILGVMLLGGCASVPYQPKTVLGLQCKHECDTGFLACSMYCHSKYDSCVQGCEAIEQAQNLTSK